MAISIALLGAGIFASDEYLPGINNLDNVTLKAVYSRSQKSAETLAGQSKELPDVYYDNPSAAGKSVDDLLKREDIDAVIICLPILVQPELIRKALSAGKHVLSEKPIAKDVATAEELIAWYSKSAPSRIWAVAENLRILDPITFAVAKLKEIGGELTTFSMNLFALVNENNKFYHTKWRKTPEYQGGFLLDGGVHFVAGLRYLLNVFNQDITSLAAFTTLLEEKLPPVDTVHAILATESGRSGSFNISFGTEFKSGCEFEVVTTKGSVSVSFELVKVVRKDASGKIEEERKEYVFSSGVQLEVDAFAESVKAGTPDPRATPQQALTDLRILQSLLESGEQKGAVKSIVH